LGESRYSFQASQVEAKACVESAEEEGQPMQTVMEEEMVQKLTYSQEEMKEEEHTSQMLTPWEKELKLLEDWLCHPDTEVGLPEECSHEQ
jgi:hypothetical protein